ncbi:MAG: hypothetical protein RI841_10260, partial [Halomonas sp.]|uniref:hypothetical protein n=1 Tax=Halomonas sp. TaxID=1486246 RepID=UPI00286FE0EF
AKQPSSQAAKQPSSQAAKKKPPADYSAGGFFLLLQWCASIILLGARRSALGARRSALGARCRFLYNVRHIRFLEGFTC